MNNELLQSLSNCYQNSSSLVLIMNLQWKVLWSNRKPVGITDLPAQLGISANHVENTVHRLTLHNDTFECRLLCNLQDGLRIAELSPCKETLRLNPTEISTAIQAISNACFSLNDVLRSQNDHDQVWILNTIMGNCYRVYRSAYLQNLIERMRSGQRMQDIFCVQTVLSGAYDRMKRILDRCMELGLQCNAPTIYMKGDADELVSVILAAVVLCCRDADCLLETGITLDWQDGFAVMTVRAEKTNIPIDNRHRINDISEEEYAAETSVLNLFSNDCHGSWVMQENKAAGIRTCTVQFPASEQNGGSISLHSPGERLDGGYFGKYSVMLSCIHYRDMF